MKKLLIATALSTSMLLSACGSPATINNKEYPTYGFLNMGSSKSEKVCYEVSIGNIVWSVLLVETIIAPIYFVGFSLFNPVKEKSANGGCGVDS